MRRLRRWGWVALGVSWWLWGASAWARPGGGQSFGGGHSSSRSGYGGGSSGGGGGSFFLDLLFFLLISHPLFGIPLLLVAAYMAYRRSSQPVPEGWSTAATAAADPLAQAAAAQGSFAGDALPPRREIEQVKAFDQGFSLSLFEDFLAALYAQTQDARGKHQLESLATFLAPEVRAALAASSRQLTAVSEVIVGGLTLVGVRGLTPEAESVEVEVRLETNFTEASASGERTFWAVELWTLARKKSARSRPKGPVDLTRCPSCGAPLDGVKNGVCSYCHQTVNTGDFDWLVTSIVELDRQDRLAPAAGGVPEDDPPTVRDADAEANVQALLARDPQFQWEALAARVGVIFGELQTAWSTLRWEAARPFVTDSLYRAETYWMDRYRKNQQRNITAHAQLGRVELASCTSDAAYDTITLRIYAHGIDYTLDERTSRVIEGSKTADVHYSEYWTLVRGVAVTGTARADKNCPSCGAPLQINMAGDCEYCRAHLTSGDFDWVLSRIEQAAAYS